MAEKYLDILPPNKGEFFKEFKVRKESKLSLKKNIFLFSLLFLIFLGVIFCFKSRQIEIKIWPETEIVKIEKEITLKEGGLLNFSDLILPLQSLEIEQRKAQKFPSSFVPKESKAQGKIRVFNLYSSTPLTLRAQTRFLSDSGKLFIAPEKIVVPGKKMEGGKLIPGQIDIKVIAAEPGPEYNIPASKFSLPGLVGTNLYTLVYGESLQPMSGGSTGQGRQVLAEDLETAENVLVEKLKKENVEALQKKADQEGKFILEETISHQILEGSSSAKAGESFEEFEYEAKVKTKAFSFEKESLERFANELIGAKIKNEMMLWPQTLKINWRLKEKNLEKGEIIISLEAEAKISNKIEERALLESLARKSISEATFLLENQFPKVQINKKSFWLRKIPKDIQKIKLEFVLD